MTSVHTSEGTLNDLEVGDIGEEVRGTRCVRISPLLLGGGVGRAVGGRMPVCAVGLDGGLMACAVGEIDWDHLGRIVGGRVTVGVRAHF